MLPKTYKLLGVLLYFVSHIQQSQSPYPYADKHGGTVPARLRRLLWKMELDLIRDAWQKIKSVQHLRSFYSKSPSFHLAERIFIIRRKFATMMRLYIEALENIGKNDIHYFTEQMIKIQQIGIDLDHSVEMLTDWEASGNTGMINFGGIMIPEEIVKSAMGRPGIIPGTNVANPGSMPGPGGTPWAGGKPGMGRMSGSGPVRMPKSW